MTIPIVTSTDERYLPGAIALHNSFLRNSPENFSFHVLAYGDDLLESKLKALGINVIMNKRIDDVTAFPMSEKYHWYRNDIESAAMYARLLVPDLFPDAEHSIYVDADALILKPLDGLIVDMGERPCAGTQCWSPMTADVPEAGLDHVRGIMTSFLVFNHRVWKEKKILSKCVELMNTSEYHFKTVVQGVLQLVIMSDYYKYPEYHQVQGGHKATLTKIKHAYFLHFCGTNPWEEFPADVSASPYKMAIREMWRQYA